METSNSGEGANTYSGYHWAAALLARFDPERLKPAFDASEDDFDRVLADSTVVDDVDDSARWALRQDVRREVLKAIPEAYRLQTRRVNLDSGAAPANDPVQRQLDAYLDGSAAPVPQQSESELAASVRVFEWAEGIFEHLPSRDEMTAALQRTRLLAPFRFLTSGGFVGRKSELEDLRNFVGHRESQTKIGAAVRSVRQTLGLRQREPLVLHGAGGSGKSTLLGQFILEHVDAAPALRYAYLDLDRAELQVDEPLTLLAEVAAQIGLQVPGMSEAGGRLKVQLLGDVHNRTVERHGTRGFSIAFGEILEACTKVFGLLGPSSMQQPFLLVLDTFEQAQYRSAEVLELLWQLFRQMTERFELLRIVIAGRAELPAVGGIEHTSIPLKELDSNDSTRLLMQFGAGDIELAGLLAAKLGGNPLVLRLAAGLVRKDRQGEAGALMDLPTRRFLFLRADSRVIQGMLYRRFLGHLEGDDPRLGKLAHPGLTLRVITPALVQEVLAVPCGLGAVSSTDARHLVRALAANVWIVTQDEPEVVRHRSDLRSVMLRLLEEDMPERFRQICEAAVTYYARRKTTADRAEEIYHRILLGENATSVRERWEPGVEQYLFSATEDLRDSRRTTLQLLLGTQVSRDLLEDLDADTRVRMVEREAARLLDLNRPINALEVLSSNAASGSDAEPTTLRLVTLRGRALVAAGAPEKAYEFMQRYSVDALASNANGALEFLLAKARAFHLSASRAFKTDPIAWVDEFRTAAALRPSDMAGVLHLGIEHLLAVSASRGKAPRTRLESARHSIELLLAQLWRESQDPLPGGSVALAWRLVGALAVNHAAVVAEIVGSASLAQRLAQQVLEAGPDGDPALPCTAVPGMSVFMDPVDRLAESYPGIMAEAGVLQREGAYIEPLNLAARARALDLIIERLSSTDVGTRCELAAAGIQVTELQSAVSLRFALGVRGDGMQATDAIRALTRVPCVYLVNRLELTPALRKRFDVVALALPSFSLGAGDLLILRGPPHATFAWARVHEVRWSKDVQLALHEEIVPAYTAESAEAKFGWSDYALGVLGGRSVAHELSVAEAMDAFRGIPERLRRAKALYPLQRLLHLSEKTPVESKRSLVKRVFSSGPRPMA